jgi:hypothetical protein
VRVAWSAARPPRLRRFLHPAVLKKRTESEKYLVPSATTAKCAHFFKSVLDRSEALANSAGERISVYFDLLFTEGMF